MYIIKYYRYGNQWLPNRNYVNTKMVKMEYVQMTKRQKKLEIQTVLQYTPNYIVINIPMLW